MKIKKIIMILIILLCSFSFIACNDNQEDNPEISEEVKKLNEYKTNSVKILNEFMLEFDSTDYTAENWTHIQTLLLNTINSINGASSESEIDNYVHIYKTTINLVSKKPTQPNNEKEEVTDEVWNNLRNSLQLTKDSFVNTDYTLKLVSQLPIDFQYVNKKSTNQRYLYYNMNAEYIKLLMENNLENNINDLYLDTNINGEAKKIHSDLNAFNEIISIDSLSVFLPMIEEILSGVGESNEPLTRQTGANEEEYITSYMIVENNKTNVYISLDLEKIINKYPQIANIVTSEISSIDLNVVLEEKIISNIVLKPVSRTTLEMLDKVSIYFEESKIDYINITTGMSGIMVNAQLDFDYKNAVIPEIIKTEYTDVNLTEFAEIVRFYQASTVLKDCYYNAKLNDSKIEDEILLRTENDYIYQLLYDYNEVKMYYNEDLDVLYVVYENYVFDNESQFGEIYTLETLPDDFFVKLEKIPLNILNILNQ